MLNVMDKLLLWYVRWRIVRWINTHNEITYKGAKMNIKTKMTGLKVSAVVVLTDHKKVASTKTRQDNEEETTTSYAPKEIVNAKVEISSDEEEHEIETSVEEIKEGLDHALAKCKTMSEFFTGLIKPIVDGMAENMGDAMKATIMQKHALTEQIQAETERTRIETEELKKKFNS